MRGINKVIIVGTLGKDPETKNFPNGGSITNFSIATSDSWTDKNTGEKKENTEWHRIVLNNRLGEIAQQYLRKGSKVYIEGSLRTRQWTDQSGQERYTTEIRGEQMQMLDSNNRPQGDQGGFQNNQGGGNNNQNGGYGNQGGQNQRGGPAHQGGQGGGYSDQGRSQLGGGYGSQANTGQSGQGGGYANQGNPQQNGQGQGGGSGGGMADDDLPFEKHPSSSIF